jgi:hypothetical protein
MRRQGYRTGEPGGIERERSLIIEKMMTALAGNGINLTQLSDELNVPLDELVACFTVWRQLVVVIAEHQTHCQRPLSVWCEKL